MKTQKSIAEFFVTLGIFLIASYMLIDGLFISRLNTAAMRLPKLVFSAIIILCAVEMIRYWRKRKKAEAAGTLKIKPMIENRRNFIIGLSFLVGYCVALYVFGFIASTLALGIIYGFLYQYKRRVFMVVYTVVVTMIIWYIFVRVLSVPLPDGLIPELFL